MQPLWETVWKFLKRIKIELPYDPAIPLLCLFLKKKKVNTNLEDTCTSMFIAALFTIARLWKQSKCPLTDEWTKKIDNGLLLSRKKNEILPFAAMWMDVEGIILSEISQKRKTNTV